MYWLDGFERKIEETVTSYVKIIPNECRIIYNVIQNDHGGKSTFVIEALSEKDEKEGLYYLSPPTITFFSSGMKEPYENFEKRIREEIVPTLRKWAIKTL